MLKTYEINSEALVNIKKNAIKQPHTKNSDSALYKLNDDIIIKLFDMLPDRVSNHIRTLTAIGNRKELSAIQNLILPQALISLRDKTIGYTMKFVRGVTLTKALRVAPPHVAFMWFSQIYDTITSMSMLPFRFHFGDLHEDNIIVTDRGELYFIDIDSFSVDDCFDYPSRYFECSDFYGLPKKYLSPQENIFHVDVNSDLFCLMHMILNYIMDEDSAWFCQISGVEIIEYLKYLTQQGVPVEFIRAINQLYRPGKNQFDLRWFNKFPTEFASLSFQAFKDKAGYFSNNDTAVKYLNSQMLNIHCEL